VDKGNWDEFRQFGKPTSDDESIKTVGEAEQSLAVPQLGEVWSRLAGLSKLGEIAKISKGIEWNLPLIKGGMETGNRSKFIFDAPQSWTREGVPPLAKIQPFQKPTTMHLSMRPEDQRRGAYKKLPWDTPKVILNAARRSRGPWRISAFADFDGLTCYRTFLAVWPKDPILATVLAAVLNGPVANAFAALREGPYIPTNWLKLVPVPKFSASQRTDIEKAVSAYVTAASVQNWQVARDSLRLVDALVLRAYDLPPRVERKLLDYFRGHARAVPFDFGDYFPADFKPFFSLADYISDDFRRSTAGVFRSLKTHAPEQVLKAMDYAAESYREE